MRVLHLKCVKAAFELKLSTFYLLNVDSCETLNGMTAPGHLLLLDLNTLLLCLPGDPEVLQVQSNKINMDIYYAGITLQIEKFE